MSKESHKDFQQMSVTALQLGVGFLFNSFFRCKKKTKPLLDEWVELIDEILDKSKEACNWLVEYLSSSEGSSYIKPFLLECPCRDVRYTMARLLERLISSHFRHGGVSTQKCFNEIVEIILYMLNKDVVDHCKNSFHYFQVIKSYVQLLRSCQMEEYATGMATCCLTRRWKSLLYQLFNDIKGEYSIL
uniref:Ubiquitin carboxyl-terminal hydrolase 24-like n=1 Tax=Crassostrea virginica TaxID=6565 RepID=A0A8B8CEE2_CRAVI|nr:ubiquitin carboxyl-terminal hydrolase 24-like [Crassostrea virginica]